MTLLVGTNCELFAAVSGAKGSGIPLAYCMVQMSDQAGKGAKYGCRGGSGLTPRCANRWTGIGLDCFRLLLACADLACIRSMVNVGPVVALDLLMQIASVDDKHPPVKACEDPCRGNEHNKPRNG